MGKRSIFSEISPQDHERYLQQLEKFSQLDTISQLAVFYLRREETNRRTKNWSSAVGQNNQARKIAVDYDWQRHADANYHFLSAMSDEAKQLLYPRPDLNNKELLLNTLAILRAELKKPLVAVMYFGLIGEHYSP